MRRAIAAAAVTVAGLIALLDYRSGTTSITKTVSASASPSTASTGSTSTTTATGARPTSGSTPESGSGSATGQSVSYQYGDIEVRVTEVDGKITTVSVPINDAPDFRSQQINTQAVPQLTSEVISAQGTSIDAVSGATYTSDAFIQSLQSALSKLGK